MCAVCDHFHIGKSFVTICPMSKSVIQIVILYSLFAGLGTLVNIGSQMLFIFMYDGLYSVEASIVAGTLVGLPLRYLLEKRYIFSFQSRNLSHGSQLFVLYISMGIFTTAIFWGTEYIFYLVFITDTMRYIGGAVGLSIGYFIKYQLDKRFVFINRQSGNHKVMV